MSVYVSKLISACERVSRSLSVLLSELHFPTRALGPITEARDLLLRAALDANEFYATERDELVRDVVKLRTDLDAAVAERDDYRDEFSGLCHTLSVGSEGRPEMTAADWRKRVDQGIDFLTRPLLSRIEATDKELAKRSNMLDICTQNCSDWIGKWKAEQDRAEQAEARLAAIGAAPVVASVGHGDYLHRHTANVPVGTLLIARPAKD